MLQHLRRAAGDLLAGYGSASLRLPPTAAAAAATAAGWRLPLALQQARSAQTSSSGSGAAGDGQELPVLPFSQALKELEAAVTEQVLPADALAANQRAMAALKEFARGLENADTPTGYPAAAVKNVSFTFRDPYAGGRLNRVRCQLKTTGGNCAVLVQQSLGQLLARLGLNPHFYFDGGQFRPKPTPPRPRVVPKPRSTAAPSTPMSAQDVQAVRAKAAAAGFPSQTISEEQFKEMEAQSEASRQEKAQAAEEAAQAAERMKKIDPLLQAVAALPWLSQVPEQADKVKMIKTKVLDEIESWGWDVRGAARRIWMGERALSTLAQGKDAGSREAIKAILFHATQNDKKYGRRELRPGQTA